MQRQKNKRNILNRLLEDERAVNRQDFLSNANDYAINLILKYLVNIPVTDKVKIHFMKLRGASVGERVKLLEGIWVDRFTNLVIGDDVSIARDVILIASGGLSIGKRTMVGHGSKLISVSHNIPSGRKPIRFSGSCQKKITIDKDVWLGAQSIILPGITLGEGCIVGAGAVVTKDIPAFAISAGVPAKIIRMRK